MGKRNKQSAFDNYINQISGKPWKKGKDYKASKRYWNNSALQQRSPAGYDAFKYRETAWLDGKETRRQIKDNRRSNNNSRMKVRDGNTSYTQRSQPSSYKPEKLDVKKRKPLTSKDLPNRPTRPKFPSINLPGGVLQTNRVNNVSGYKGDVNKGGKANTMPVYSAGNRSNETLKSNYRSANIKGSDELRKFKKNVKGMN